MTKSVQNTLLWDVGTWNRAGLDITCLGVECSRSERAHVQPAHFTSTAASHHAPLHPTKSDLQAAARGEAEGHVSGLMMPQLTEADLSELLLGVPAD
eukprot:882128-Rhodomonas_salina.1